MKVCCNQEYFRVLEQAYGKPKIDLGGLGGERTSVGFPHAVEVVGSPYVKAWTAGFQVDAALQTCWYLR